MINQSKFIKEVDIIRILLLSKVNQSAQIKAKIIIISYVFINPH